MLLFKWTWQSFRDIWNISNLSWYTEHVYSLFWWMGHLRLNLILRACQTYTDTWDTSNLAPVMIISERDISLSLFSFYMWRVVFFLKYIVPVTIFTWHVSQWFSHVRDVDIKSQGLVSHPQRDCSVCGVLDLSVCLLIKSPISKALICCRRCFKKCVCACVL